MAPLTERISEKAIAVVQQGDAIVRPSKIPRSLRFPLLSLLSVHAVLLYSRLHIRSSSSIKKFGTMVASQRVTDMENVSNSFSKTGTLDSKVL
jgi:hypothetical protein